MFFIVKLKDSAISNLTDAFTSVDQHPGYKPVWLVRGLLAPMWGFAMYTFHLRRPPHFKGRLFGTGWQRCGVKDNFKVM